MDSKTLVGITLCVLFYLGYSQYLGKKYPGYGKPTVTETSTPTATSPVDTTNSTLGSAGSAAPSAATIETTSEIKRLTPEELRFETDTNIYQFSQELGAVSSIKLKNYKTGKTADAPNVELLDSPLTVVGLAYKQTLMPEPNEVTQAAVGPWNGERKPGLLRLWRSQGPWEVATEFHVPEKGYAGTLDVIFTNKDSQALELTSATKLHEVVNFKPVPKILGILPGAPGEVQAIVTSVSGKTTHTDMQSHCEDGEEAAIDVKNEAVNYFGIDSHYFLKVLEPAAKTLSLKIQRSHTSETACGLAILGYQVNGLVQPGESVRMSYATYFGPKDMSIMQSYNEHLPSSVNLGFFGFIAKPLLIVIHGFHNFFGNYGVAIIVLTILLKTLFYPLMKASATSMHKMKKLNPQMAELRERFKDDKPRQQQELMKFMAANNVNPMKGCLPILPQIPVFFAFYQVLQTAIELRHAPFYGWIHDLSTMDPYFVTPILMGVAMVVQQKLTPTTGMDKTQEKILMFMPIMFTAMMLTLPAGMTLYMLTNTVFGIAQQKWLYRKLDKSNA